MDKSNDNLGTLKLVRDCDLEGGESYSLELHLEGGGIIHFGTVSKNEEIANTGYFVEPSSNGNSWETPEGLWEDPNFARVVVEELFEEHLEGYGRSRMDYPFGKRENQS